MDPHSSQTYLAESPRCPACNASAIPILHGTSMVAPIPTVHALLHIGDTAITDASWWCDQCEEGFVGPDAGPALDVAVARTAMTVGHRKAKGPPPEQGSQRSRSQRSALKAHDP